MKKLVSTLVGAALLGAAGPAGAAAAAPLADEPTAADDVVTLTQQDPFGDVKLRKKGRRTQQAPRRIKRSVDIGRAIYRVDRTMATPSLVVTTEVRNVLPADHAYTQRFRTDLDDYYYYFTYFWSDGAGVVKVRYLDRGGDVRVRCPGATVRLWPGPRKERVVQTIPLSCIHLAGSDLHFSTTASVVPRNRTWFVAEDRTRRTTGIDLEPLSGAGR